MAITSVWDTQGMGSEIKKVCLDSGGSFRIDTESDLGCYLSRDGKWLGYLTQRILEASRTLVSFK